MRFQVCELSEADLVPQLVKPKELKCYTCGQFSGYVCKYPSALFWRLCKRRKLIQCKDQFGCKMPCVCKWPTNTIYTKTLYEHGNSGVSEASHLVRCMECGAWKKRRDTLLDGTKPAGFSTVEPQEIKENDAQKAFY